ncbi:MAG TPA: aspartate aminotransferase [Lactobacillus sp.]|nr:aspartate aminotransferase [Lactobacillus sp.]
MEFTPSQKVRQIPKSFFADLDKKIDAVEDQSTLIDLAKGNPDQPTPEFIIDELKIASEKLENHRYTPFEGKTNFLKAISSYYQKNYGVTTDPFKAILTFNGSAIGISAIPQVFLDPGDYVVTTDPCYPEYDASVALAGGKLYQLPITEANDYLPDLESIPDEVLQKTKILLLNYPNNPTGAEATSQFFEKVIQFCKLHHILAVNDFAYAALSYDERPVSILEAPEALDYAIELNTFSKTYNMAGWRAGYVLGNESAIAAIKKYHDHVYSTIFGAVQDAATVGLESDQSSVEQLRTLYRQRRDTLVGGLKQIGWNVVEPKGTFFVWVKAPEGLDGEQFTVQILEQTNIVVAPGIGFGSNGRNYIRLSLTHDESVLKEVVERLSKINY